MTARVQTVRRTGMTPYRRMTGLGQASDTVIPGIWSASPDYRIDSSGNIVDCNSWSGVLSATCWGFGGPSTLSTATSNYTPPAVDCSQLANLSSSQCTLSQYLSSNLLNAPVLLMAGGLVLALVLIKF